MSSRNRSRSSTPTARSFLQRGRRLAAAPLLPARVSAGFVALAILFAVAATGHAPATPSQRLAQSCKPLPPFGLVLEQGASGSWTLHVSNLAQPQVLEIWMWSDAGNTSSRQRVWRGVLARDEERRLDVSYTPVTNATRVWASVEPPDQRGALLRGVASVGLGDESTRQALEHEDTGRLLHPASGETVYQYTGKLGGAR